MYYYVQRPGGHIAIWTYVKFVFLAPPEFPPPANTVYLCMTFSYFVTSKKKWTTVKGEHTVHMIGHCTYDKNVYWSIC